MAEANFGLISPSQQPAMVPAPLAAGILSGLQSGQKMRLNEQQIAQSKQAVAASQQAMAVNKQAMSVQKLQQIQNIAGTVALSPPDQQPQSYAAALHMAGQAGLDVSSLPPAWGPDAHAAVNQAFYSSGQVLDRIKAQTEVGLLSMNIGHIGVENQRLNWETGGQLNLPGGAYAPSPMPNGMPSGGVTVPFPGSPPGAPQGYPPPPPPQQGASIAQSSPGNTPVGNGPLTPTYGPGTVAGQKTAAENNATWNQMQGDSLSNANEQLQNINLLRANINNPGLVPPGKFTGPFRAATGKGQQLDKVKAYVFANKLAAVGFAGQKLNQTIDNVMLQGSPSNASTKETNLMIADIADVSARTAKMNAQMSIAMQQKGLIDKSQQQLVMSNVLASLPIQNPDTGEFHPSVINFNSKPVQEAFKAALDGKPLPEAAWTTGGYANTPKEEKFESHDGTTLTYSDILKEAGESGLTPPQVMAKYGMKPVSIKPESATPTPDTRGLLQ